MKVFETTMNMTSVTEGKEGINPFLPSEKNQDGVYPDKVTLDSLESVIRTVIPNPSQQDITSIRIKARTICSSNGREFTRSSVIQAAEKRKQEIEDAKNEEEPQKPEQKSVLWEITDSTEELPFEEDHAWERAFPKRQMLPTAAAVRDSLNNIGDAQRFCQECRGEFLYDLSSESWKVWNGTAWVRDTNRLVQQAAVHVAESFSSFELKYWSKLVESGNESDSKLISEMRKHVDEIKSIRGIRGMLEFAKITPGMFADLKKEADYSLLSCRNGIFDMSRNKFFYAGNEVENAGLKERYPIRFVDRIYHPTTDKDNPQAKPLKFLQHLATIMTDNSGDLSKAEVDRRRAQGCGFYRRLLGYSLLGGNPEMIIVFLWGRTKNGKSMTMDIIAYVMGDEFGTGGMNELIDTGRDDPCPRISKSISKTILYFQELDNGSYDDDGNYQVRKTPGLSQSKIKVLTGEEWTDLFRGFREDSESKRNVCLPIAVTNELPRFSGKPQPALLERILTIPHPHYFSAEERNPNIKQELMEEADKIFSLMIDECMKYLELRMNHQPGFPSVPDFWKVNEEELLAGVTYYSFVKDVYRTATSDEPNEKILVQDIHDDFKKWCKSQSPEIRPNMIYQNMVFTDAYGAEYDERVLVLTKSEKSRIRDAMTVMGFRMTHTGPNHYWRAVRKH